MAKGKPLPFTAERWTGRLDAADLDLLRAVHPNVNEVIAALVHGYCDRLRERLSGSLPPID